ncbi:hypothetical protein Psi01_62400 [Planobispora siamensis]|uniref:Uncharacterized protein n=1 Tax=Planobispora siamensis TaxID=936338 RepID=A0A8J3SLX5_9ACTN|nr:hypothetical protein Psi01_62400 [Planobispora siamensis]
MQRGLGGRAGLGAVGDDALPRFAGDEKVFEIELHRADDRVTEAFDARGARAYRVAGPACGELLALDDEPADELGQAVVVRMAPRRQAQGGDGERGLLGPVRIELAEVSVEEEQPGQVGPGGRTAGGGGVEVAGEQRVTEPVPGQDVVPAIQDQSGRLGHRLQQPPGRTARVLGPDRGGPRGRRGPGETLEMGRLVLGQPQGAGQRAEYGVGGARRPSLLQPGVVGHAHTREHREFLTAQS